MNNEHEQIYKLLYKIKNEFMFYVKLRLKYIHFIPLNMILNNFFNSLNTQNINQLVKLLRKKIIINEVFERQIQVGIRLGMANSL